MIFVAVGFDVTPDNMDGPLGLRRAPLAVIAVKVVVPGEDCSRIGEL